MVIKVKQPKRDAQGKTKVDRQIAARKAAQGNSKNTSQLSQKEQR